MIESQISKVSRDKGTIVTNVHGSFDHEVIVECVGVIMDRQVPLLIIDRRGISVMSTSFVDRRVTPVRFNVFLRRYGI
jgi:hypothetical protein